MGRHSSRLDPLTEERGQDNEQDEFDLLIDQGEWDQLCELLRNCPVYAQRPSFHRYVEKNRTKLHRVCSDTSAPTSVIRLLAMMYPEAITMPDFSHHNESTPLQTICRHAQSVAEKLKILLLYAENPSESILNCDEFGQTALHYASKHDAAIEVLHMLVHTNPEIVRITTKNGFHPIRILWDCSVMAIKSSTDYINYVLNGETPVSKPDCFEESWYKIEFLASEAFKLTGLCPQGSMDTRAHILHGLLHCVANADFLLKLCLKTNPSLAQVADAEGNLPFHVLLSKRCSRRRAKKMIEAFLEAFSEAAAAQNFAGDLPLMIAIRKKLPWQAGLKEIVAAFPTAIQCRDLGTRLFPFQLAAATGGNVAVNTTYQLLLTQPDLVRVPLMT